MLSLSLSMLSETETLKVRVSPNLITPALSHRPIPYSVFIWGSSTIGPNFRLVLEGGGGIGSVVKVTLKSVWSTHIQKGEGQSKIVQKSVRPAAYVHKCGTAHISCILTIAE